MDDLHQALMRQRNQAMDAAATNEAAALQLAARVRDLEAEVGTLKERLAAAHDDGRVAAGDGHGV